jgi:hypothetical protein
MKELIREVLEEQKFDQLLTEKMKKVILLVNFEMGNFNIKS